MSVQDMLLEVNALPERMQLAVESGCQAHPDMMPSEIRDVADVSNAVLTGDPTAVLRSRGDHGAKLRIEGYEVGVAPSKTLWFWKDEQGRQTVLGMNPLSQDRR